MCRKTKAFILCFFLISSTTFGDIGPSAGKWVHTQPKVNFIPFESYPEYTFLVYYAYTFPTTKHHIVTKLSNGSGCVSTGQGSRDIEFLLFAVPNEVFESKIKEDSNYSWLRDDKLGILSCRFDCPQSFVLANRANYETHYLFRVAEGKLRQCTDREESDHRKKIELNKSKPSFPETKSDPNELITTEPSLLPSNSPSKTVAPLWVIGLLVAVALVLFGVWVGRKSKSLPQPSVNPCSPIEPK